MKHFEKIFNLTEKTIEFYENVHTYKLKNLGFDLIDAEKESLANKPKNNTFFIDDDDDPYNGEMILFNKVAYNTYEINSIKCSQPNENRISSANLLHLNVGLNIS